MSVFTLSDSSLSDRSNSSMVTFCFSTSFSNFCTRSSSSTTREHTLSLVTAVNRVVEDAAGVDGVSVWLAVDDLLVMVAVDVVVMGKGSIIVFDDRPTGDMLLLNVTLVGRALMPPMLPAPPITVVVVALPVEFSSTMVLDVSDEMDIFVASDDIDFVIVLSLAPSFFAVL